jgi:hypothetical protein
MMKLPLLLLELLSGSIHSARSSLMEERQIGVAEFD